MPRWMLPIAWTISSRSEYSSLIWSRGKVGLGFQLSRLEWALQSYRRTPSGCSVILARSWGGEDRTVGIRAYIYFLPWVLFVIVDRSSGLGVLWAASTSLVCGVGILALVAYRKEHLFCGVGFVVTFGSTLISYALMTNDAFHTLEPFARFIVSMGIGVVILASLLFTPASEDHLRSITAPSFWGTEEFRRANMRITSRWGITMLAVSIVYGAEALSSGGPIVRTVCDWFTPLLACLASVHWDGRTWHDLGTHISINTDGVPLGITDFPPQTAPERQSVPEMEEQIAIVRELRQRSHSPDWS